MIPYLTLEDLLNEPLMAALRADETVTYFWSNDWSPEFYRAQAMAGMIAVATEEPEVGEVLLPEMQEAYAVLHWENLHIGSRLAKRMRNGSLDGYELRFSSDLAPVLAGVDTSLPETSWLNDSYRALLTDPVLASPAFTPAAVELRHRESGALVAGEIGYTIGQVYTSLTGFVDRSVAGSAGLGTLQLVLLAQELERNGYAFWNLGHPSMEYKKRLGAVVMERGDFLQLWGGEIS